MKKLAYIIPLITVVFMILSFAGCKKDTDCRVKIICKYTDNGIDTGDVVPGCFVELGKPIFADFARDSGYCNNFGVYETVFQYEALLEVNASHTVTEMVIVGSDTSYVDTHFAGRGEVKLIPGEVVEKVILLMEL